VEQDQSQSRKDYEQNNEQRHTFAAQQIAGQLRISKEIITSWCTLSF